MSSKPLKIFHIIVSPTIGGAERLLLTLASQSDKSQLDIILGIFTHRTNDIMLREALKLGLTAEPIEITNAYEIKQFHTLYKAIKKHRPDIIHSHGYKTNILGFFMAKLFGLPIITTFHGWVESQKARTRIFNQLCFKLLPFFNATIAVSDQIGKSLETMRLPSERVVIIKNIPTVLTEERGATGRNLRKELKIPEKACVIGFIGRLEPVKGCRQFIQAASIAAKQEPDSVFLIIGEGNERAALDNKVKECGLKDRVIFCGYRSDMFSVYSSLDLFVLSSLSEGLPLTVLEAMYYGVPVIATNVGGVPEIVKDGINGILVPPNDEITMAKKIVVSLRNREETGKRVLEGKKTIEKGYTIKKWLNRMESLYKDVHRKNNSAINRTGAIENYEN